ncbi:MAG: hypothetical protein ACYDDT_00740 [Sulfuricella sp.]
MNFYQNGANDTQLGMIFMAAAMSTSICEECGAPGRVLVDEGMWLTCCAEHVPADAITLGEYLKKKHGRARDAKNLL